MSFELPNLPYAYNALEPHIDARTMEIHHSKHHAAYTNNLNNAIKGTDLEGKSIEAILANVSKLAPAVRNNGGGFYNHNLFWTVMSPDGGGKPSGDLGDAINKYFGSFDVSKRNSIQQQPHVLDQAGHGFQRMRKASWLLVQAPIRTIRLWIFLR